MITFMQAEVATGGAVSGSIAAGQGSDSDVAWLVWRLAAVDSRMGRAMEDYALVDKVHLDRGPGGTPFEFRIPEQGPVSYEGKLFRVVWEIVAGTQSPSSGPEIHAHAPFRVVARAVSSQ